MRAVSFNRATHLSIVWGVTMAVLTLIEWRSLEREPMKEQILLPFIERSVLLRPAPDGEMPRAAGAQAELRYEVELGFNGPLFLLCFFTPVLLFQGIGALAGRAASRPSGKS